MTRRRTGPLLVGGCVVVVLSLVLFDQRTAPVREVPEPVPAEVAPPPAPPPPPVPVRPEPAEPPPFTVEHAVQLAGPNGVVCATDPVVDGARATLEVDPAAGFLGVAVLGGGFLVLSEVPPAGEGVLQVEGFAPTTVRWSDDLDGPGQGGCDPAVVVLEPSATAVVGRVTGAAGREVTVEVCGRPTVLEDDGAFYADATPGEPCDVVVRRHFGVMQWEERRTLTPSLGRDSVVQVDAPDIDAVVPLVLVPDERGLRVAADWTGSDLEGAVVQSIDDTPAGDAPVDFHLAVGGSEGDIATVELADGRTIEVELRALTFDDWLVEN